MLIFIASRVGAREEIEGSFIVHKVSHMASEVHILDQLIITSFQKVVLRVLICWRVTSLEVQEIAAYA